MPPGITGPVVTEPKVLSNCDPRSAQPQREDLGHEQFRFEVTYLDERKHTHDIHAARVHHPRPFFDCREQLGRSGWVDELEGVGIERQSNC